MHVRVDLGTRSYDILVASHFAGLGEFARQRSRGKLAVVIGDENVTEHRNQVADELAAAGFRVGSITLPPGESQKALPVASEIYDRLVELEADRQTLIVAVGGGVIGDLAGFVAATYARGLSLLMIPTTLLSMVDSSVGGKVAVNHPRAKNLIGAFHQPAGVWINTASLATLPQREFRSGLAEVVKYGVILDADFFEYLEKNAEALLHRDSRVLQYVVTHCCQLKASVVERDEREETGLRAVLNYGHTFAHAFEAVAGYGTWLHGEAVAAGMICASRLAERRGLIGSDLTERQKTLLKTFQLPTRPEPWPLADMLTAMRSDKKTLAGRLRFILPIRLGEVALFDDIETNDVESVLREAVS
ncbi:MAG: 3-dehydroquinate synthase [Gemmatales bacterium]|nr:MAG: 3-dehydroquinate synthase [Gemmatales bacterium]